MTIMAHILGVGQHAHRGTEIPTIAAITLQCVHCHRKQPPGIAFTNAEAFRVKTLPGNPTKCAHCHQMTPIRKDLMTVTFVSGEVKNGADV